MLAIVKAIAAWPVLVRRLIAGVVVAGGLVGWFRLEMRSAERRGEGKAIERVKGANDDARRKADTAGAKSLSGAGGLRNPQYRD